MTQPPLLPPTPGQTIGPFFGFALPYDNDANLVAPGNPDAVRLHGYVYDGAGDPVPDALLELWQTDEAGEVHPLPGSIRRDPQEFTGWGRAATDPDGYYSFTTLTPGAPFFALTVFARGLLSGLFTRAYLPDRGDDPFLAELPEDRRNTLVTRAEESGFRFDIHLQGPAETVFLSYCRQ